MKSQIINIRKGSRTLWPATKSASGNLQSAMRLTASSPSSRASVPAWVPSTPPAWSWGR